MNKALMKFLATNANAQKALAQNAADVEGSGATAEQIKVEAERLARKRGKRRTK